MKTYLSIFFVLFYSISVSAQTVYYYELSNGKGDGHFIAITKKGCYDSDNMGVSLENGFRFFKGTENEQYIYHGYSHFGDAKYYFSHDYNKLKIVVEKSGIIYNYIRKNAPKGIASAHGNVPDKSPKTRAVYHTYQPTILPTINSSTSTPSTYSSPTNCSGCGGSGLCTMCHGKGWYKNTYSGNINNCSSCGGSGRCGVCRGKGTL